tara:strand:- start:518 stop:1120 length:603 start_codon:yes stop_codon:yes gene_type:complete
MSTLNVNSVNVSVITFPDNTTLTTATTIEDPFIVNSLVGNTSLQTPLIKGSSSATGISVNGSNELGSVGRVSFSAGGSLSKAPVVYHVTDPVTGCPGSRAADTDLYGIQWTAASTHAILCVFGTIGNHSSRFDTRLLLDGTQVSRTLTSTNSNSWKPATLTYGNNSLAAGQHQMQVRCTVANILGCGGEWGRMTLWVQEF